MHAMMPTNRPVAPSQAHLLGKSRKSSDKLDETKAFKDKLALLASLRAFSKNLHNQNGTEDPLIWPSLIPPELYEHMAPGAKMVDEPRPKAEPEEMCLKLLLWIAQGSFECRCMLPESTYEKALKTQKLMLRRTVKDASLRSVLSLTRVRRVLADNGAENILVMILTYGISLQTRSRKPSRTLIPSSSLPMNLPRQHRMHPLQRPSLFQHTRN